jgi:hypothetical protein
MATGFSLITRGLLLEGLSARNTNCQNKHSKMAKPMEMKIGEKGGGDDASTIINIATFSSSEVKINITSNS